MEFADLVLNRKEVEVMGIPVTIRRHSVAFRNYSRILTIEGRRFEQETDDETGKTLTRMVDGGSLEQCRKIVRETVKDAVVSWGLALKEGGTAPVTEQTLAFLDENFPEFLAGVFDAVEEFNQDLPPAKKKT